MPAFPMGDGVAVQAQFTLVDMVKASMTEAANALVAQGDARKPLVGELRKKFVAVLRWLIGVACVAAAESLHADTCKIAENLGIAGDVATEPYAVRPGLTIEAKREVKIPAFVAALNSGGSAFLVQVMVKGASVFFCNDDMARQFINAAEAEEEHANHKEDPGSVMRKLVAARDRPAYLRATARLLVHLTVLAAETSFMAHVMSRDGNRVLCLVQLRASFSADGDNVVFGTKLIPVPDSRNAGGEGGAAGAPGVFASMPGGMPPNFFLQSGLPMMPFNAAMMAAAAQGGPGGTPFPPGMMLPGGVPFPFPAAVAAVAANATTAEAEAEESRKRAAEALVDQQPKKPREEDAMPAAQTQLPEEQQYYQAAPSTMDPVSAPPPPAVASASPPAPEISVMQTI